MLMPRLLLQILLFAFLFFLPPATASSVTQEFKEAPQFYNSPYCPSIHDQDDQNLDPESDDDTIFCSDHAVHVAMTLDTAYIRGSMAAILSVLQHSSCPQNVAFHFVVSATTTATSSVLSSTISTSFPYLKFRVYPFDDSSVSRLISTSIRSALDCPLNYARSYLAGNFTILVHLK